MTDKQRIGRPPKPESQRVVSLKTTLPRELKEKYSRLGGGAWLAKSITDADEPQSAAALANSSSS